MQNTLWKKDDDILRVLECHDDEVLVIDCKKLTMPTWKSIETLEGYTRCEDALDPKLRGFRDMDVSGYGCAVLRSDQHHAQAFYGCGGHPTFPVR